MPGLVAASMESYERSYENILRLHLLQDIESLREESFQQLWSLRLKMASPSYHAQERILMVEQHFAACYA